MNLSMRLPRWAHKQMKAEARAAGRTAADLYGEAVTHFLQEDAPRFRKFLLTGPSSSPSVTLALPKATVARVRELADECDMVISDIIYTAVLVHLGEVQPQALAKAA
ncbi:MAG: hypothetical protein EPO51_06135 [Phenylobacterium sp.]|uniref:hypothetical protein n=1 Tax=Phenylobacterium sp. TaxID=1871053 RepID=UPI00120BD7BB|nr:hypothetical protein [Phenylobacterium sp.]TAJ73212.1 MAG: hypothetical protein EPO51_06135 [Phenylobacterium sp.]